MSDPSALSAIETVDQSPGDQIGMGAVGASRTLAGDAWEKLRGNWTFWLSVVLILLLVVMAIWPGLFTHTDPSNCQAARSRIGPSGHAWFGYDSQGCDVFAGTIYGARASMMVGAVATLVALVLGAGIGVYAGFYGGWVDTILSRITDIFLGLPVLLGSIVILSSIPAPPGSQVLQMVKVALAIAGLGWTQTARVARSAVIQIKEADFVAASRAIGAGQSWMIRRHIVPNIAAPVIVVTTLSLGAFIGAEAALSFLGLGLQAPVISWGIAIDNAAAYVRTTPHMLFFPAAFLSVTVLAFIALGEAVREALDPKAM